MTENQIDWSERLRAAEEQVKALTNKPLSEYAKEISKTLDRGRLTPFSIKRSGGVEFLFKEGRAEVYIPGSPVFMVTDQPDVTKTDACQVSIQEFAIICKFQDMFGAELIDYKTPDQVRNEELRKEADQLAIELAQKPLTKKEDPEPDWALLDQFVASLPQISEAEGRAWIPFIRDARYFREQTVATDINGKTSDGGSIITTPRGKMFFKVIEKKSQLPGQRAWARRGWQINGQVFTQKIANQCRIICVWDALAGNVYWVTRPEYYLNNPDNFRDGIPMPSFGLPSKNDYWTKFNG